MLDSDYYINLYSNHECDLWQGIDDEPLYIESFDTLNGAVDCAITLIIYKEYGAMTVAEYHKKIDELHDEVWGF